MQRGSAEECAGDAGRVVPVVDRNRCEAKAACVQVCPFDVFEIRPLEAADRAVLTLAGKLKAWVHGNRQAYVVRADDCHACGLCIKACPEKAIRLVAVTDL
ncbi:MAG: ferredoxin family protein [Burkholderiales bacterium]|nr:ferredoxin family protein [Burkholderiales bacterium]